MIEIEAALAQVRDAIKPGNVETLPLVEAVGHILAEPVDSDIDSPPYDKALMDGYAIRSADLVDGTARLQLIERVTAGQMPTRTVGVGQCTQIMTGTPLPDGADAVVMVERTERIETAGGPPLVAINDDSLAPESNILRRAASMREGARLFEPGQIIRASDVGLLAEVGRAEVRVFSRPSMAIVSTGDELVPHTDVPAAGQIRNSNGPMLSALGRAAGASTLELGIGLDHEEALTDIIARGLEHDVLVLSGGVSAGVLDLVPKVLESAGVKQVFHKVNLKPGKPIWFGIRSGDKETLVFGLPGNPVSSLVCFRLFVHDAVRRLAGAQTESDDQWTGKLADEFEQRTDRPTYWPATSESVEGELIVHPLKWQGSADQRTIAAADCLVFIDRGPRTLAAGEIVPVMRLGGVD